MTSLERWSGPAAFDSHARMASTRAREARVFAERLDSDGAGDASAPWWQVARERGEEATVLRLAATSRDPQLHEATAGSYRQAVDVASRWADARGIPWRENPVPAEAVHDRAGQEVEV